MRHNPFAIGLEPLEARTLFSVAYTVTDLGTVNANAMNDNGDVVGGTGTESFLYSGGKFHLINPFPAGTTSAATAINDSGLIAISTQSSLTSQETFLDTNGHFTDLAHGNPVAINNAGQVVSNPDARLVNSDGSYQNLGTLDGFDDDDSTGYGMNDAGDVVGVSALQAFLWTPSTGMNSLGDLGTGGSVGFAINNSQEVVGQSSNRAFVWTAATGMQDLGVLNIGTLPSQDTSMALGINDAGDVVGYSVGWKPFPASPSNIIDFREAFLYHAGQMIDLNTLIDPKLGITLTQADAINSKGQILVSGTDVNDNVHSYLLTPGVTTGGGNTGSSVSGSVFNDTNGDGAKEKHEGILSGISIVLQYLHHGRPSGHAITTASDRKGRYSFTGVSVGNYLISEVVPHGYKQTTPHKGGFIVSIPANDAVANLTFGDQLIVKPAVAFPTTDAPGSISKQPEDLLFSVSDVKDRAVWT